MEVNDDGLYFGPCLNPGGEDPIQRDLRLSNAEIEELIKEFRRKAGGTPKLLTPLPRRVRLRLAFQQAVTDAGIWLCDHRMWRLAGLLWWRR